MRVVEFLVGLMAAMVVFATSAQAEDIALIFGDTGQIVSMKNRAGVSSQAFALPLRQAGFKVIEPYNRSGTNMRFAAQSIEPALADDQFDRLVIIVLGPYARNERESWVLANDAAGSTSLSVATKGISLNALSDLAERAGDRAVIMLARGAKIDGLGAGLEAGLGKFSRASGVTYVVGGANQLLGILQDGLLDPGKTFADVARDAPQGVKFSGFVSRRVGLMGQAKPAAAPDALEQGFWQAIEALDTVEGYRLYLDDHPTGLHRKAARDRIAGLKDEPERLAREAEDALNLPRDARRGIQRNLALLGFNPRGIDGLFGPATRAAVAAWQSDNRFDQTGFMTGNQVTRLNEQAKLRAAELEEEARLRRLAEEQKDRAYWRETGVNGDEADLRKYLMRYPDGLFAERAAVKLARIEESRLSQIARAERDAWKSAKERNTVAGYRSFLGSYPGSGFSAAAHDRIRNIETGNLNAAATRQAKAEEKNFTGVKTARRLIEQRLAHFGTKPGVVDGKFDKRTRGAIRRFQRDRGLPVTGFVSRATMVRLMTGG